VSPSCRWIAVMVLLVLLPISGGCYNLAELYYNQTASLGGDTVGGRGAVGVVFINNTPYRAVFTAGSYDQTDQFAVPDFEQFGLVDDEFPLEGESQTAVLEFRCARVFGVGSSNLHLLMEQNLQDVELIESARIEGVEFFAEEGGTQVSQGLAPPLEVLLGTDFPCEGLLIFRLELDDVGDSPFRVDYQVVASESTR